MRVGQKLEVKIGAELYLLNRVDVKSLIALYPSSILFVYVSDWMCFNHPLNILVNAFKNVPRQVGNLPISLSVTVERSKVFS